MLTCGHDSCSKNWWLKCVAFNNPYNYNIFSFRTVFSAGDKEVFELRNYVRKGVCRLEKTCTIPKLTFSWRVLVHKL